MIHEILKRAMQGESEAFGEIILQYEKPIFVFLYKRVKDKELALDLLQETFTEALIALPKLRDPDHFSGWLFKIARRKAWVANRQSNDWDEILEPIPITCSAYDEVLKNELSDIIRKAIEKLPEKLSEVIQLHYLNEMTYPEICEKLGIPTSTLKSRLHHARKQLHDELAPFVEYVPISKPVSEKRRISMEIQKPEIKITEVPGAKMEVELVEVPNRFIKLEEGAVSETIWFRNWADGKNIPFYLIIKDCVVGRATVEDEECWEIEVDARDTKGKRSETSFMFYDRREDGFYHFGSISRGKGTKTQMYTSSPPVSALFPVHLASGMEYKDYANKGLKTERVVDVSINEKVTRALEALYTAIPYSAYPNGETKILRLNRTYIGEDGKLVLFERYHSIIDFTPSEATLAEIEYEGRKWFLYHYVLPKSFVTI